VHGTHLSAIVIRCLFILMLFSTPVLAAGGTCPSGANYPNAAGTNVTLASLGVTTCFYASSSGSDTNSGTTEASPWLHFPGMSGCSNNCSITPTAGEGFIVEGGSVYHFGKSSASPYISGGWNWSWTGTSSAMIYVGVDPAWYSGSSWARPIFTGDNPTSTSTVGSCAYQVAGGNNFISINPAYYNQFDNFELTGLCWNNTPSGTNDFYVYSQGQNTSGVNGFVISNMYIHGWTVAPGWSGGACAFCSWNGASAGTLEYNIVDGSDSLDTTMDAFGQGRGVYVVQYNVIRHVGGSSAPNNCHIVHDNLFEYINNSSDGSTHSDVFMCYGETSNGSSDPNLFYNNIFRYIGTEYSVALSAETFWLFPPSGQTDYVFNNVAHDIYSQSNYFNNSQSGGPGGGAVSLYNNTMVNPYFGNNAGVGTWTSVNNHWITTGSESTIFQNPSNVTSETKAVYMTPTTAASQGYTSANDYSPTLGTNSTVGAGTNNATFCNGLSNAAAKSACLVGTTDGCSYNSSSHSISCPGIVANARPSSGAWDVGAHEYLATNSPAPPTGLVAVVH
jgi:hypothetical protein